MRHIDEIILHCTATRADWASDQSTDWKVAQVRSWHMNGNGWRDIGYHYLVDRDGTVAAGRPVPQTGAHTRGHNKGTIGIALFGGHGSSVDDEFHDNYTDAQMKALDQLIADLKSDFPITRVSGHNEYANKACPGFNVPLYFHD